MLSKAYRPYKSIQFVPGTFLSKGSSHWILPVFTLLLYTALVFSLCTNPLSSLFLKASFLYSITLHVPNTCAPLHNIWTCKTVVFIYFFPLLSCNTDLLALDQSKTFYKPDWFDIVGAEVKCCKEAVCVIDMSSFTKFELTVSDLRSVCYFFFFF